MGGEREPNRTGSPQPKRGRLSHGSLGLLVITLLMLAFGSVTLVSNWGGGTKAGGSGPGFDLQGHRGARGLYPENSLPGFEGALALGVTTLEADLGLTRDGVVVVHHDLRLNPARTRGPDGAWIDQETPPAIKTLSLAALQRFDVGRLRPDAKDRQRFPDQAGRDGVVIPALAAVLKRSEALTGGRIHYKLELKISPLKPEASPDPKSLLSALIAEIDAVGLRERVTIQSFDWGSLALAAELAPDIRRSFLTVEQTWFDNLERGRPGKSPWTGGHDLDDIPVTPPQAIARLGGSVWSPYYRDITPADLREARNLGLEVIVWTVNDPNDMAGLIEDGVDGIITDYPDRLRQVLENKGRPLPPAFTD